MKSLVAFMTCAAMIAWSAYHDDRFSDAHAVKAEAMMKAAERVELLPLQFGSWRGAEHPVADEEAMRRGGAVRYLCRDYKPVGSDELVNVLLLCGKPGPLSVHTPEVCTAGVNYAADGNQTKWNPSPDAELTWQTFSSRVDGRPNLEIAWAWTTDGRWESPQIPRLKFGREAFLYKIYVVRSCGREAAPSRSMNTLLADLIPAMKASIFAVEPTADKEHSTNSSTDRSEPRVVPLSTPSTRHTAPTPGGPPRG